MSIAASRKDELVLWLAIVQAPGIGPRTVAKLLARFAQPSAILAASQEELQACGVKPDSYQALQQPDQKSIAATLEWLQQPQTSILILTDPDYPARLAQLPDAPPLLYIRGDRNLLTEPQIAIVGTRHPTKDGREITRDFSRQLASYGFVITSGLASGIDSEAHIGALESGRTLAVLGTGPDRVYPALNRELAHRIAENGALITEFPLGVGPLAQNFPRRNRVISGLSLGVLITEATQKSGSLITAYHALEQGKEIFATPGSIRNLCTRGCHALLREGAKLIEDPAEILAELAPQVRPLINLNPDLTPEPTIIPKTKNNNKKNKNNNFKIHKCSNNQEEQCLLKELGDQPITPDELIARTGISAQSINSMLLILELNGQILSTPGGRYQLKRS